MNGSRSFQNNLMLAALLAGTLAGACNSSKSGSSGTGGRSGSGGAGGDSANECAHSALTILFNPMYSAYDGVHTFQLPAIVNGIDQTNVQLTWSVSDPSTVALAPDPATGGVMMTMQKAGNVMVYAHAGSLCGAAPLTITAATPDEWMAGSKRYNDGVVIGLRGTATQADGGDASAQQAACTNCHGETAKGSFLDVAHTPEQTGGFSDDELIGIFQHGTVPQGGYFDATIVPYALWQGFHQWDVGDAAKGVVVYLRSLTPTPQKGAFNIGALLDAGFPEAGSPQPDGGAGGGGGGGGAAGAAGDDAGAHDQ